MSNNASVEKIQVIFNAIKTHHSMIQEHMKKAIDFYCEGESGYDLLQTNFTSAIKTYETKLSELNESYNLEKEETIAKFNLIISEKDNIIKQLNEKITLNENITTNKHVSLKEEPIKNEKIILKEDIKERSVTPAKQNNITDRVNLFNKVATTNIVKQKQWEQIGNPIEIDDVIKPNIVDNSDNEQEVKIKKKTNKKKKNVVVIDENTDVDNAVVTNNTIANNTIANNTIDNNVVAENLVTDNTIANNVVAENLVTDNTIDNNVVAKILVTDNTIAENLVTDNTIANNVVFENLVTNNTIAENLVTDNVVLEDVIVDNAVKEQTKKKRHKKAKPVEIAEENIKEEPSEESVAIIESVTIVETEQIIIPDTFEPPVVENQNIEIINEEQAKPKKKRKPKPAQALLE